MKFVLNNCVVLMGNRIVPKKLLINNGKIEDIVESNTPLSPMKVVDCKNHILIPGLIDTHVHFRVPGAEHKEDWVTGSSAAIAGGVTTVVDMPNNNPSCTTRQALEEKIRIAKKDSKCNFAFHFGAGNDNFDELRAVEGITSFKVFMGSSTGNLLVTKTEKLREIFSIAKERGFIVTVHAEDETVIRESIESAKELGWDSATYHDKIRSNEAEEKAIARALFIQKEIGNALHICHVSSREGLGLIRQAKKEGRPITCEVTPHHLFLDATATQKLGNFAKMNPSLKSAADVQSLWNGIADGTVDIIATDHAPHTRKEKEKPYWEAPSGVPGVETMLPLLLNEVAKEKISLQKVVKLCCENPAKIYGFKTRGAIRKGMDADLVLIDLQGENSVKNGTLKTKCNWSPFSTMKLKGTIEKVFVSGQEVA